MREPSSVTADLQQCLNRLRTGDDAARTRMLEYANDRLTRLTRKMLRDNPRVKRWEQTEDVFQNAALRLYRALADVQPGNVRDFFRLAAVQIRRELIDLARHHYGSEGAGRKHESGPLPQDATSPSDAAQDTTRRPDRLAVWTEFHEQVGQLPDPEQEVFHLLWYHDLKEAEAAALLGVSVRTLQRRWQSARLKLHDALGGEMPF